MANDNIINIYQVNKAVCRFCFVLGGTSAKVQLQIINILTKCVIKIII